MNFADLNKEYRNTVKEGIDTDAMEYKALKEFVGQNIVVDGYFFNDKGKYGKQVVVVGNGYLINMPKRCVEQFEQIDADETMLQRLLEGHLMLANLKMKDTTNGTTVIFDYVDC